MAGSSGHGVEVRLLYAPRWWQTRLCAAQQFAVPFPELLVSLNPFSRIATVAQGLEVALLVGATVFDWNLVVSVPSVFVQPEERDAAVHAPVPLISADPASQIF